ncbi:unnamed protein product [Calypogeia fissa]
MLHLTTVLETLPDSFADVARVTRSHVPAANAPSRIDTGSRAPIAATPALKRGRPPGSTDKQPRQRRTSLPPAASAHVPAPPTNTEHVNTESEEISIHYNLNGQIWDRSTISMDNRFAFQMSKEIVEDLPDPKSIKEASRQPDWDDWQRAIHSELDSLISGQVFGPITPAPPGTHLTGYTWTFVKKQNAQGVIVRYKARLIGKGFTHIPGRDYDLTYSPIMDIITYRYLIAFALHHGLSMHQMDIVTAYLYGNLDKIIYMEAPPQLIQRVAYHSQGEHKSKTSGKQTENAFGHTNMSKLQKISRSIECKSDSIRSEKALTARINFAVQVL